MTRTKSMTHFIAYAEGMIALEHQARGLAEELFLGLKELAIEVTAYNSDEKSEGTKDLKTEFAKSLSDLEYTCKDKLVKLTGNEDATLTSSIPSFKVRKSELNKGIKAGIDPSKYDSFSAYRKAIDKATDSNSDGRSKPTNEGNKGEASAGSPTKLHTVTNDNFSKAVQESLKLTLKHLAKLPEKEALEALKGFDGKIHQLLGKVGGRYSNVKTANS